MPADASEVGAWIREYTPRLYGVALAFSEDADEAEDLLQELWWRANRKAWQRSPTMPPGAWLHAILLNIGRSRWQRRRRRERILALWHLDHNDQTAGSPPDVTRALRYARLWRAIGLLPELQRTVVLLRVVDDRSTADVAALLDRAEGTVKASLHRALRTLRREMSDEPCSASIPEASHDA